MRYVAALIRGFIILVIFVICASCLIASIASAREGDLWSFIFSGFSAAICAVVVVFALLNNPTEVQPQQLAKPEGWIVIWLGPHVAIALFGGDAVVTVYGPYCD